MTDDSAGTYAAGITISICCSTLNSSGMGLQKKVHMRLQHLPAGQRVYWKEKSWLLGLVCMTLASLLSLGNFALLGQSRASAMASLTIITNAIMSKYYLHESFSYTDAASTVLIATGIIIAVIFGSAAKSSSLAFSQILDLLERDVVYAATGIIITVFIASEVFVHYAERLSSKRTNTQAKIECFLRAFLAGLFSGSTGYFAKCVVVTVQNLISTKSADDLKRYQFWLFALALPVSVVMQLRHLNGGLRRFDAMEVVPIYQACIVTIGVTWGWTFYAENESLALLNEVMFAVGCALSVAGIIVLGHFRRSKLGSNSSTASTDPLVSATASIAQTSGTGYDVLKEDETPLGGTYNTGYGTDNKDIKPQSYQFKTSLSSSSSSSSSTSTVIGPYDSNTQENNKEDTKESRSRRGSSITSITPGSFLVEAVESLGSNGLTRLLVGGEKEKKETESPYRGSTAL